MQPPGAPALPLVKQLTLRDGMRVWFHAMPEHVIDEIDEYALELVFVADPAQGIDAAHIFVTQRAELAEQLGALRSALSPEGQIWVSWPCGAAGIATDITEDAIRAAGEPHGLIATKECAIDADWAALKLVIRKELR